MKLLVLALCLAATGCGAIQQAQNTKEREEVKIALKACQDAYPAVVGGMVTRSTCINNALMRFTQPAWAVLRAERMAMAEKVDRGELTVSDMKLQLARLVYDLSEREKQQAAAVQAAHESSQAAAAPAWGALGIAGLGMATQRPATPNVTTCNVFNRSMTCVGY